jgi:parvulin-like peptidyl-prolyl isomerase
MPQTTLYRTWVPCTSLSLLIALAICAAFAHGQQQYGPPQSQFPQGQFPQAGYGPVAPPYAPQAQYAPPAQGNPYPPGTTVPGPSNYPPPQGRPFGQVAPGGPSRQPAAAPEQDPLADLFTPAKIVARVGNQPILAGDLIGDINQMLEPYKDQASQEELDQQRLVLMRNLLDRLVETKLVYMEFLRTVPQEQLPTVEANLAKAFDEEQLDDMIKRAKVANAAELDAKLRDYGTSLDKQRKRFGEQYLAQMIVRKNVNYEPEITHREMLAYYQEHLDEYTFPATAKWEHLMASFEKHGSQQAAYQAIAAMGNEVVGGAPLAAVAKRSSDAPDAVDGGLNESTTQGALVWTEIDATLFSIPANRLSTIIKTSDGFHIVRVLQRKEAGKEAFVDAQVEIKAQLKKQKIKADAEKFLTKVKAETPVWTIFDDLPAELAEGQSYKELMRR